MYNFALACVENIKRIYVILRTEIDFSPKLQGTGTGNTLCSLFDSEHIY